MTTRFLCAVAGLALLAAGCAPAPGKTTLSGKVVLTGVTDASGLTVALAGPTPVTTTTAADGTWRATKLKAGTYAVTIAAPSTVEITEVVPVTVPASGTATAPTLTFSPVGSITGTVTTASGAPALAGTLVVAAGTTAKAATALDGSYTLRDVPVGTVTVVADDASARANQDGVVVKWKQSTKVAPLALATPPPATGAIEGTVVIPGGVTYPYLVTVSLEGPVAAAGQVDTSGHYQFTDLPAGTYLVTAAVSSTRERTRSVAVTVTSGSVTAPPLAFTPVAQVLGEVNLDGPVAAGAMVAVLIRGASGEDLTFTGGGQFTSRYAPVGQVTIQASCPGFQSMTTPALTLQWGQRLIAPHWTLEPAASGAPTLGTVQGVARPLAQSDAAGITVTLTGDPGSPAPATTATDGRYAVSGVVPGVYTATFDDGPYRETIPQLLSMPGTDGFVVGDGIQPLAPLDLPRGRRLVSVPKVYQPALSADGTKAMLYITPTWNFTGSSLMLLDVATGAARTVSTQPARYGGGMRLSPDGTRAFWYDQTSTGMPSGLYTALVDGGLTVQLLSGAPALDFIYPDGKALLVQEPDPSGTGRDEVKVPVDGSAPTVLVTGLTNIGPTTVSPDGTTLLVQNPDLAVASLATGQITELVANASGYPLAQFADGGAKVLVVASPSYGHVGPLDSFAITGGAPALLADNVVPNHVLLTADGKQAVFLVNTTGALNPLVGDLESVSVAGGSPVPLATGVDVFSVGISPGGQTVTYTTDADKLLHAIAITGGTPATLSTGPTIGGFFSADGSEIVWRGACNGLCNCEMYAASLAGGGVGKPIATDVCGFDTMVLSRHGGSLFYFHTDLNGSAKLGTVMRAATDGSGTVAVLPDAWGLWTAGDHVFASRVQARAPFGFQEGFYDLSHL